MAAADIKYEIRKVIDEVPESVLEDVLDYLMNIKKLSKEKIELSRNLGKILREDNALLQRLAL